MPPRDTIAAMAYLVIALQNLAALLPVWFGHWSVFALLGLYWFENVVTGVIQFEKMRLTERAQPRPEVFKLSQFFAIHYGAFTLAHGVFVLVFFGFLSDSAQAGGARLWWVSAIIVATTLWQSFQRDFVQRGEAQRANIDRLMFEPYGRVVVLHLVVLLGGYLALSTAHPRYVLLLLVLLKLCAELVTAHLKSGATRDRSAATP